MRRGCWFLRVGKLGMPDYGCIAGCVVRHRGWSKASQHGRIADSQYGACMKSWVVLRLVNPDTNVTLVVIVCAIGRSQLPSCRRRANRGKGQTTNECTSKGFEETSLLTGAILGHPKTVLAEQSSKAIFQCLRLGAGGAAVFSERGSRRRSKAGGLRMRPLTARCRQKTRDFPTGTIWLFGNSCLSAMGTARMGGGE